MLKMGLLNVRYWIDSVTYNQESTPSVGIDRANIIATNERLKTRGDTFANSLLERDTDVIDPEDMTCEIDILWFRPRTNKG